MIRRSIGRAAVRAQRAGVPAGCFTAALVLAGVGPVASAAEIDTGNPELKLRWDNTVKYSNALRLRGRDAALLTDPNQDDGNRNFARGLISNRFDLLSEADLAYRDVGARVSAAGWFDSVYRRANDNDSAGAFGPGSSTSNSSRGIDQFTAGTRKLHGAKAEVLDAFVYGRFQAGQTSTTVRLGRHALVWGESLFLGANAIAGAQGPTDIIKALSVPNSQVKEIVLPVPQISVQSILTPEVSIGAYYQFRYVGNRFPGVGSYFSVADFGPQGRDFAYGPTGPTPIFYPAVKDRGQGGVQLRLSLGETDLGFYALRFHNKGFQFYPSLGLTPGGPAPTAFNFGTQEDITAYGASFSRTFGNANVAGEASIRRNTDLASTQGADASALLPFPVPPVSSRNPVWAVGNTGHVNLSTLWSVPRTPLWQEATFVAEVAWNRMLSCERNCAALSPSGTRDAWQLAAVMTPGLNVSVPLGVNYTPKGSRSLALGAGASGPEDGGSVNLGLQGLYLDAWRFGLTYTRYFGSAATFVVPLSPTSNDFSYRQTTRDRDYLAFSLSRTF
jgi:hypothetical protein